MLDMYDSPPVIALKAEIHTVFFFYNFIIFGYHTNYIVYNTRYKVAHENYIYSLSNIR